jgi:hypothetical protein
MVVSRQSCILKKQLDLYKYVRLQYRLKTGGRDPVVKVDDDTPVFEKHKQQDNAMAKELYDMLSYENNSIQVSKYFLVPRSDIILNMMSKISEANTQLQTDCISILSYAMRSKVDQYTLQALASKSSSSSSSSSSSDPYVSCGNQLIDKHIFSNILNVWLLNALTKHKQHAHNNNGTMKTQLESLIREILELSINLTKRGCISKRSWQKIKPLLKSFGILVIEISKANFTDSGITKKAQQIISAWKKIKKKGVPVPQVIKKKVTTQKPSDTSSSTTTTTTSRKHKRKLNLVKHVSDPVAPVKKKVKLITSNTITIDMYNTKMIGRATSRAQDKKEKPLPNKDSTSHNDSPLVLPSVSEFDLSEITLSSKNDDDMEMATSSSSTTTTTTTTTAVGDTIIASRSSGSLEVNSNGHKASAKQVNNETTTISINNASTKTGTIITSIATNFLKKRVRWATPLENVQLFTRASAQEESNTNTMSRRSKRNFEKEQKQQSKCEGSVILSRNNSSNKLKYKKVVVKVVWRRSHRLIVPKAKSDNVLEIKSAAKIAERYRCSKLEPKVKYLSSDNIPSMPNCIGDKNLREGYSHRSSCSSCIESDTSSSIPVIPWDVHSSTTTTTIDKWSSEYENYFMTKEGNIDISTNSNDGDLGNIASAFNLDMNVIRQLSAYVTPHHKSNIIDNITSSNGCIGNGSTSTYDTNKGTSKTYYQYSQTTNESNNTSGYDNLLSPNNTTPTTTTTTTTTTIPQNYSIAGETTSSSVSTNSYSHSYNNYLLQYDYPTQQSTDDSHYSNSAHDNKYSGNIAAASMNPYDVNYITNSTHKLTSSIVCRNHQRGIMCKFGSRCRFMHSPRT